MKCGSSASLSLLKPLTSPKSIARTTRGWIASRGGVSPAVVLTPPADPPQSITSVRNPRSRQLQPPRFLGGSEPEIQPNTDRRTVYAAWLTSAENPHFARSMSNRIWSYFFHRGIIDPVDDLRSTNPPINGQLLDALTADFIEHKFDVRHLMRRIVLSDTYQRSSIPNESNAHDVMNFSRAVP